MAGNFFIVGVDEVGRGCLAGPVVAAAVIIKEPILGIMDSKKLTKKRREELDKLIRDNAIAYGIGLTEIADVNKQGLTYAVSNAMRNAIKSINLDYEKIIIDGNYNYLPDYPNVEVVVKADDTIPAVSAASILAKVYRDNLMIDMSKEFPEYGFEKHVGYGTKYHLDMIKKFGPCNQHRMFYKPLLKYSI
jgi:ribonuclease HII